jgi:hypothetical protein
MPQRSKDARERRDDNIDRGWHFDKHLSVNTLVSILGMAIVLGAPLFYWGNAMDKRVGALEISKAEKDRTDVATETASREQRTALTAHLDKMDDKLTQMQVQVGQLVVQLNLSKPGK